MINTIRGWFDSRRQGRKETHFYAVAPKPEMDNLFLKREIFTDKSTIGSLSMGGTHLCYTLEDTCRAKKVYGETAIWAGRYEIVLNYSNKFKRPLPLLLNVEEFRGVRIHGGNRPKHTLGCILIGKERGKDLIWSTPDHIFSLIESELKKRKLYIDIVGGFRYEEAVKKRAA